MEEASPVQASGGPQSTTKGRRARAGGGGGGVEGWESLQMSRMRGRGKEGARCQGQALRG